MGSMTDTKLLTVDPDTLEQVFRLNHYSCKRAIEAWVAVAQSLFDQVVGVMIIAGRPMRFCDAPHILCVCVG